METIYILFVSMLLEGGAIVDVQFDGLTGLDECNAVEIEVIEALDSAVFAGTIIDYGTTCVDDAVDTTNIIRL